MWKAGVVPFLEALWGAEVVAIVQRDREGHDTSNLHFCAARYAYETYQPSYNLSRYILGDKSVHVCTLSYEDILTMVIDEELPIRLAHVKLVEAFSRLHADKLIYPLQNILHVHDNYPSEARLRRAECMARSVTDPESPLFSPLFSGYELRRVRAEVDIYTGDLDNPFAVGVGRCRKVSRDANDRRRGVEISHLRFYAEGFSVGTPKACERHGERSRFFCDTPGPPLGELQVVELPLDNTPKRSRFFA